MDVRFSSLNFPETGGTGPEYSKFAGPFPIGKSSTTRMETNDNDPITMKPICHHA